MMGLNQNKWIITLNVSGLKHSNQNTEIKKKKYFVSESIKKENAPTICCLLETEIKYNDIFKETYTMQH